MCRLVIVKIVLVRMMLHSDGYDWSIIWEIDPALDYEGVSDGE